MSCTHVYCTHVYTYVYAQLNVGHDADLEGQLDALKRRNAELEDMLAALQVTSNSLIECATQHTLDRFCTGQARQGLGGPRRMPC